jgi:bifunctional DNA-binding transcriptional regulator/antitoxin component of YhaV-PrlF toxin-antitoxin module
MNASAMTTSIDEAGRILLPQHVQSQLGVKPGDKLALQEVNGQWFLKPVTTAADCHDDLNWEELDYGPIPTRPSGQVTLRIEQRGKLMPMAHDLDDE